MRQPFGRGMRAVRDREGIIDINVAMRRDPARELGIVGLLARPEADVLEQADIACAQDSDRLLDHRPHDFGNEHDLSPEHRADIALDEANAHGRVARTFGAAVMRQQQHLGALVRQFENGVLRGLDAGDVGRRTVLHRQVEIDADQRNLAGEIAEVVA